MAKIIAVTGCIAGIAHTYMAAANLKKSLLKRMETILRLKHKGQWALKIG